MLVMLSAFQASLTSLKALTARERFCSVKPGTSTFCSVCSTDFSTTFLSSFATPLSRCVPSSLPNFFQVSPFLSPLNMPLSIFGTSFFTQPRESCSRIFSRSISTSVVSRLSFRLSRSSSNSAVLTASNCSPFRLPSSSASMMGSIMGLSSCSGSCVSAPSSPIIAFMAFLNFVFKSPSPPNSWPSPVSSSSSPVTSSMMGFSISPSRSTGTY